MNTTRIDYLNIGLMLVAAVAAFVLPFEVFLFSYAVLGPLHYLTEISWLHKKGYFTRHKNDYLMLVGLAVVLLAIGLSIQALVQGMTPLVASPKDRAFLNTWATVVTFVAFSASLTFVVLKEATKRTFALLAIAAAAIFLRSLTSATILFAIFLPTLIHVFVFTGAFVLYGALKNKSKSGLLSFAAFVLVPVVMYLCNDAGLGIPHHGYTVKTYLSSTMYALNVATIKLFHLGDANSTQQIFDSGYGMLVMRFIAYAYTYHYLNWFSKTSVIQWHKVSKGRLAIVLVLWAASVALYAFNYHTGLIALYGLSFMHVFLEFPLNHVTFLGIGRELRHRLQGVAAAAPSPITEPIPAGATAVAAIAE